MNTTARTEEYLESIYKIQSNNEAVTITKLSDSLNISPASVSEMIKKLVKDGYIVHENREYTLTGKGFSAASLIVRRHRLSERLLTDIIGVPWDKAHDEACKFEHIIGEDLEERLVEKLGDPDTCPHGHPIPGKDGTFVEEKSIPLTQLKAGDQGEIVKVEEDQTDMLHYLATLGLLPKTLVKVEDVSPFGGPFLIDVSGAKYALGREVAAQISVRSV